MAPALAFYLGLLIVSFIITSLSIVPFIDALYRVKFQRQKQVTMDAMGKRTSIFDKFHKHKAGTPVGGGLLIIATVTFMFIITFILILLSGRNIVHVYPLIPEIGVIFFTFLSFGLLGFYDDLKKFFGFQKSKFFGMRMSQKFILQWILAFIIAIILNKFLGIEFLHVPFLGVLPLGIAFIPFAAFTIVSFTNAVNITDGLDGLAGGVLAICLFGFWILSASFLDTTLSIFLSLWIGALIAFLYFNVHPARIFMGDVGALAFGATLAVVGLLLGKVIGLIIIGGIFFVEVLTSGLQLWSKHFRGKKLFPVAPFHLYLQKMGWPESKIVMRAWLAGIILTIIGLWLSVI
jgi:phospho-N-acetylmuramoyl-pentapeptide-transferase